MSAREPVDVEQGDRDLAALALGPRDLELEHAASVRAFARPVRGSVWATRSSHSARSVAIDDVRNVAIAAAARSAIATSSVSSAVSTSCVPGPAEREHADARLDAAARDDQRQVRDRSSAPRRRRRHVAPERAGPVERRLVDRVAAFVGDLGLEGGDLPSSAIPRVSSSSSAPRSGSWAKTAAIGAPVAARTGLDDHRERGVEVVGARERGRAGREDGERAAGGTGGFGHVCLRCSPARARSGSTAGAPSHPSGRVGIVHRAAHGARGPVGRSRRASAILAAMKLVVAIVHNEDAGVLVDALLEREFRATRLHSSGGFLKQSNATVMLGVEDDEVDEVMASSARTATLGPRS